jgi:hypothetical protein
MGKGSQTGFMRSRLLTFEHENGLEVSARCAASTVKLLLRQRVAALKPQRAPRTRH